MPYRYVLFDADNTLLDFAACEEEIIAWMEEAYDLPSVCPDGVRLVQAYRDINAQLWRDYEEKRITPDFLRIERFRRLLERAGRSGGIDQEVRILNEAFIERLGQCGALVPGAQETIRRYAPITIVTNGFAEVQRSRIRAAGLADLVGHLFISEEIGHAKPDERFFASVFAALDEPDRSEILIVGDSLSSDVRGGSNAGIATCWFDRFDGSTGRTVDPEPTHRISDLSELPGVIGR